MKNQADFDLNPLTKMFFKVFNVDLVQKYEFLLAQLEVAQEIYGKQFRFTDAHRSRFVKLGIPIKSQLSEICKIFKPETLLRWHRNMKRKKWDFSHRKSKRSGRPPIDEVTEKLIVNMAEDNRTWGYDRIVGELKKLGYSVSDTTVGNVLKKHGIPPAPDRNKGMPWKDFIKSHMQVAWATDFFTEEVWTMKGLVTFYVLFFVNLATRKVWIAGATQYPNAIWMKQQARNFSMILDENTELSCKILIRDRDQIYVPFDGTIKTETRIVKTPKHSPWCNGYAERFVREARETLNNLILCGQKQLMNALKKVEQHHNFARPHQGIDNIVPLDFEYPTEPAPPERIKRRDVLSGLLNSYHDDQAA